MCFFAQNSTLTIEEFHSKLQEATNFPLRPFVIPFLKVSRRPSPLVAGPAMECRVCSPSAVISHHPRPTGGCRVGAVLTSQGRSLLVTAADPLPPDPVLSEPPRSILQCGSDALILSTAMS